MSAPRIMVIDDDLVFLTMIQTALADEGYEVVTAGDGTSAYSRMIAWLPDVIILDIRMQHPRAGWVLLDLLRAHPRLEETPVLVCTGDQRFLLEKAQRLRVKGCLTLAKPFDVELLLDLIDQALGQVQASPARP